MAPESASAAWWEYNLATEGRILVEASDLPGNVTSQEIGWNTLEEGTS